MRTFLRKVFVNLLWVGPRRRVKAEKPRVIVITGSVGKTSTKEALARVLKESGRPVVSTFGNLATDTGVPLSLLGYKKAPKGWRWFGVIWKSLTLIPKKVPQSPYYVLEYSSDKPGDISFLASKIPADVGIITQVSAVHLQFFAGMEELLEEETALKNGLAVGGQLVTNADDSYQQDLPAVASVSLKECEVAFVSNALVFTYHGVRYQSQVAGRHQLYSLLVAITVGEREGISQQKIQEAVRAYEVPAGRGKILEGKYAITLIDDSYNSSPKAAIDAVTMLREVAGTRRSVAILGRMNELGDESERLHVEVATAAITIGLLIFVGEYAGVMTKAAVRAGQPLTRILSFATPEEAIQEVPAFLQPADVVLIKGSQNAVRLERLVKVLMLNPERAHELLVRQAE